VEGLGKERKVRR